MQKTQAPEGKKWLSRILWLVAIWAASIAVLGLVAYGLRLFMNMAGLSTPG